MEGFRHSQSSSPPNHDPSANPSLVGRQESLPQLPRNDTPSSAPTHVNPNPYRNLIPNTTRNPHEVHLSLEPAQSRLETARHAPLFVRPYSPPQSHLESDPFVQPQQSHPWLNREPTCTTILRVSVDESGHETTQEIPVLPDVGEFVNLLSRSPRPWPSHDTTRLNTAHTLGGFLRRRSRLSPTPGPSHDTRFGTAETTWEALRRHPPHSPTPGPSHDTRLGKAETAWEALRHHSPHSPTPGPSHDRRLDTAETAREVLRPHSPTPGPSHDTRWNTGDTAGEALRRHSPHSPIPGHSHSRRFGTAETAWEALWRHSPHSPTPGPSHDTRLGTAETAGEALRRHSPHSPTPGPSHDARLNAVHTLGELLRRSSPHSCTPGPSHTFGPECSPGSMPGPSHQARYGPRHEPGAGPSGIGHINMEVEHWQSGKHEEGPGGKRARTCEPEAGPSHEALPWPSGELVPDESSQLSPGQGSSDAAQPCKGGKGKGSKSKAGKKSQPKGKGKGKGKGHSSKGQSGKTKPGPQTTEVDATTKKKTTYTPHYVQGDRCAVCGDLSTGTHYRAMTCEGCKGFFRRTIQNSKGKTPSFICKKSGKCPVNTSTRNGCQHCRYYRCLAAKMDPASVLSEEQRKRLKAIIQKNRMKRRLLRPLTEDEMTVLRSIGDGFHSDDPSEFYTFADHNNVPPPVGSISSSPGLRHALDFIMNVPGMNSISHRDFSTLFRAHIFDILALTMVQLHDPRRQAVVFRDVLLNIGNREYPEMSGILEIIEKFSRFASDPIILGCLAAIQFLSVTEGMELEDENTVTRVMDALLELFQKYLRQESISEWLPYNGLISLEQVRNNHSQIVLNMSHVGDMSGHLLCIPCTRVPFETLVKSYRASLKEKEENAAKANGDSAQKNDNTNADNQVQIPAANCRGNATITRAEAVAAGGDGSCWPRSDPPPSPLVNYSVFAELGQMSAFRRDPYYSEDSGHGGRSRSGSMGEAQLLMIDPAMEEGQNLHSRVHYPSNGNHTEPFLHAASSKVASPTTCALTASPAYNNSTARLTPNGTRTGAADSPNFDAGAQNSPEFRAIEGPYHQAHTNGSSSRMYPSSHQIRAPQASPVNLNDRGLVRHGHFERQDRRSEVGSRNVSSTSSYQAIRAQLSYSSTPRQPLACEVLDLSKTQENEQLKKENADLKAALMRICSERVVPNMEIKPEPPVVHQESVPSILFNPLVAQVLETSRHPIEETVKDPDSQSSGQQTPASFPNNFLHPDPPEPPNDRDHIFLQPQPHQTGHPRTSSFPESSAHERAMPSHHTINGSVSLAPLPESYRKAGPAHETLSASGDQWNGSNPPSFSKKGSSQGQKRQAMSLKKKWISDHYGENHQD